MLNTKKLLYKMIDAIRIINQKGFSVVSTSAVSITMTAGGNATAYFDNPEGAICICGYYYTGWSGTILPYNIYFGTTGQSSIVFHNANNSSATISVTARFLCWR